MIKSALLDRLRSFTHGRTFNGIVISVILFSAVSLGLETNPGLIGKFGYEFKLLDRLVILFFVLEIALKIISFGKRPLSYFKDTWNVVDFVIVVGCLIPSSSNCGVLVISSALVKRVDGLEFLL